MKLRIASAEDLLAALMSDDLGVVAATHRTPRLEPARGVAFGAWEGRDAVDGLLAQAEGADQRLALMAVQTVALFDDNRVRAYFLRLFDGGRGWRLEAARMYLAGCRSLLRRHDLYGALRDDASVRRVRAAAHLLGPPVPADPDDVALRLALLQPETAPPPPDDANLAGWLRELGGPLDAEARAALETCGRGAFDVLAARHGNLTVECMAWLLEWGVREWPVAALPLMNVALDQPILRPRALQIVAETPAIRVPMHARVQELALSEDAAVRLHAVRAGADLDWPKALEHETDGEVRALCVLRWGAKAPSPALVDLLTDEGWQVRAAASEVLATRDKSDVVPGVQPLLRHPRKEVRAAAVQVMAALGEASAVEEALLAP